MLWTEFCPDGAKNDVVGNVEATSWRSDGRGLIDDVQHVAQHVASMCLFLFWCAEVSSKAKETVDESTNSGNDCLERHCWTPRFTKKKKGRQEACSGGGRSDVGSAREGTRERSFLHKKERHAEGPDCSHEARHGWKTHFRSK